MSVERLWAPWRVRYVSNIGRKAKGCIFCRMLKAKNDRKNFIFCRSKTSFAVLNIYPYNNGHCLVLPYRHVKELRDLNGAEREDLWDLLDYTQDLLDDVLHPAGYNIGINYGHVGGAGSPGHVHIHIVPRWKGDVNFMPVTAQTKVIPQSLQELYERLCQRCRSVKRK